MKTKQKKTETAISPDLSPEQVAELAIKQAEEKRAAEEAEGAGEKITALAFGGAQWSVPTLAKVAQRCASSMGRTPLNEEAAKQSYSRKGVTSLHEYDWNKVPVEIRPRVKAEIDVALAFIALAKKLSALSKVSG